MSPGYDDPDDWDDDVLDPALYADEDHDEIDDFRTRRIAQGVLDFGASA